MENVSWLQDLAGILTVFFVVIFVVVVIRVLKWKREKVEEYKNMPLTDNDSEDQ